MTKESIINAMKKSPRFNKADVELFAELVEERTAIMAESNIEEPEQKALLATIEVMKVRTKKGVKNEYKLD